MLVIKFIKEECNNAHCFHTYTNLQKKFRCSNVAIQCDDAQMYWSTLRLPVINVNHGIEITTLEGNNVR